MKSCSNCRFCREIIILNKSNNIVTKKYYGCTKDLGAIISSSYPELDLDKISYFSCKDWDLYDNERKALLE